MPHLYLSTACLHAVEPSRVHLHEYCKNIDGQAGPKRPARCKWCGAECVCACHLTDKVAEHREILRRQGELVGRVRHALQEHRDDDDQPQGQPHEHQPSDVAWYGKPETD